MAVPQDRLRRELERIAAPADPTGVVAAVLRRARRRHAARSAGTAGLVLLVIGGTVAGLYGLARVLPRTEPRRPAGDVSPAPTGSPVPGVKVSPFPIHGLSNGRIAYVEGGRVVSIRPDGSDPRVIPTPAEGNPWSLAWSPDGTRIAVTIFPTGPGDRSVWVMDADGSHPRKIAAADNVSRPSWSPDGRRIAYSAQSGARSTIHVVSARGTGDRVLYGIDAPGTRAIFSASFSPDGTEILFDQGNESRFDIFVMRADGSEIHRLTSTGTDYDPHWSPDGTRIAFARQEGASESDIFVMRADGSGVRRLTNDGPGTTNLDPEWSPDGTRIAYQAGVTGGPGGLVVMASDGSHPRTIVQSGVLGISWQSVRR